MKMDDINPFGEHNETDEQPDTDKTIPFTLGGVIEGGPSWGPDCEQETSFGGGKTQSTRLKESFVEKLYYVLSEETVQTPDASI